MGDFDGMGNVEGILHFNPDDALAPGGGVSRGGEAHLEHERAGRPVLRAAVGDLGHAASLLKHFHHVHFGCHARFLANVSASHMPS